MNPEIKQKWLTALRSGDYHQGTGALKKEVGPETQYCCLGVLCDIAAEEGATIAVRRERDPSSSSGLAAWWEFGDHEQLGSSGQLPESVQKWSGVGTGQGDLRKLVNGDPVADSLVALNDSHHFTFEQIADVIEDQF